MITFGFNSRVFQCPGRRSKHKSSRIWTSQTDDSAVDQWETQLHCERSSSSENQRNASKCCKRLLNC